MEELGLARVLHVLGVVHWIGGVFLVTAVILPAVRRFRSPQDQAAFFEQVEHRFAWQARVSTLLTGASGLWLVHLLDAWGRFAEAAFWWMHAMVAVWAIFTLMLFVLEPLVLRRVFARLAARDPGRVLALVERLHWVLLTVSLVTVAGAVAGSHGWHWF